MNLFKYILPIIFTTPIVKALDTNNLKFVSLATCKTYYTSSVTPVDGQTVDTYCSDKLMNALEICIDSKINQYATTNKITFANLTNTEQLSKKSQYNYECQLASQTDAAKAAQAAQAKSKTGSAATLGTAATAAAVAAAAALAASNNRQNSGAQSATQLLQQLSKTPSKDAPANGAQSETEALKSSTEALKKAIPNLQKDVTAESPSQSRSLTPEEQASADVKSNYLHDERIKENAADAADKADPYSANYENASDRQSDLVSAQNKIAAEAEAASKQVPQASEAFKKASDAAQVSSTAPGNSTVITASAQKTSSNLISDSSTAMGATAQILEVPDSSMPYSQTIAALQKIQTDVKTYTTAPKESCTSMAEKASMLCVEGTSPGAKAAKEVMDVAGPVLGVITSAQKTCSSTAKVTQVVNSGLMIAKGVCIAAKLTCDHACGVAVKTITQMNASIQNQLSSAIINDYSTTEAQCHSRGNTAGLACSETGQYKSCYDIVYLPCTADNSSKRTEASSLIGKLQTIVSKENVPATPGTSPAIAAGCVNHVKDIAMFALQVYGTASALKSAKACAEKLATTAAGGAAVTTQQYCEKPENLKEQLCLCQKDPMSTGCPGALAAAIGSTQDPGTNIKATKGASAFAGGFGTNPSSALSAGGISGDKVKDGITGKDASATDASSAGGNGYVGGKGANGGVGSQPGAEETTAKKPEENKKWSFGAFSGSGGGFASFFGGGAGKSEKSGSLSQKDMAAVKRQIASERISAEVSSASGKSNWEKVRNMYLNKEASFLGQ